MSGFPIEIDATQLFVRGFIIPGKTPDFLDSLHVQTVLLEPGSYQFQIQSGVSADFVFVVTPEGRVDYERIFDGFLAGRGSSRLTILGFEVTLDARGLTGADSGGGVLFAQMPRTNDDWISVKTCRLVPQTIYQVQQGSGELCSFTFALARDGTFSYDETHDVSKGGALSGQGTSRLEFHGFKVTVDATGITKILVVHPIFGLKAVDDGRLSVVVLPAGPFSLQLDRGVTGLGFSVGIHGEVTALPHLDELLAIEQRDGDTLVRVLAISVAFAPRTMDFGGVVPGSSGPNIIPETTPGTPLVSTNGAVIITVPDNTRVTAAIVGDTTRFKVRDIILLREVLEPIDPQPPGHPPLPPIKMKVPEEVGNSDGITPLSVETGQILYVRVEYHALHVEGTFTATLSIKGETWNPIEVPLSLFLANVITTVDTTHLDVVKGEQVIVPITVVSTAGPATNVSYQQSRGDPHVGLVITDTTVHVEAKQSVKANLTVTAQRDAAVGPKSLFVYQTAFNRTVGMILPVNVLDAPLPGTGIDSSVQWVQPVPFAIQIDEKADGWNAGRVHDVISLGSGGLLLGTSKGGVWVVNATDAAVPHSNDWDNPDINCLARGLDDRNHFYAGCDSGGALFESEPDTAFFGFLAWHEIPVVDADGKPIATGSVYRIAVVQQNRKLVLASQNGVFWADIPSLGGRYVFRQASALPAGAFSGATPGPDGSVVVGARGDGTGHFGIFLGDWSSGDLVFQRMTAPNESKMVWTTLASCDGDLSRMYAAASNEDGVLISMLRHNHHSDGMNWNQCNTDLVDAPPGKNLLEPLAGKERGGWIKTLRVSPTRPDVVTINWANSYISFSGGGAPWEAIDLVHVPGATDWDRSPQYNAHMHADGHATVFDMDDERTLYIATDGGVAMTPDRGHTFFSKFNAHLANLMFDCQPGREGTYGTLAVSAFPTGLIAGGLQDNGDLYCQITPGPAPWQSLSTGDGAAMQFLPVGQRLIWYVKDDIGVKVSRWDGAHFVDTVVVPRADGSPKDEGLRDPYIELVERPSFRDSSTSQLMVAVGCPDGSRTIYGLFVDADGGNMKWQSLGLLPSEGRVRALASLHGDSIWIGTAEGRIFSMGSKSGSAIEFATPRSSQPGGVDRFLIVSEELAYAVYNTTADAGFILQSNLLSWDPLGSNSGVAKGVGLPTNEGSLYAMAIDRDARPPALFAATDNRVYVSRDEADTWRLATSGLPKRPHCADLRVDRGDGHNRFLYMSTFGRSVWRAALK